MAGESAYRRAMGIRLGADDAITYWGLTPGTVTTWARGSTRARAVAILGLASIALIGGCSSDPLEEPPGGLVLDQNIPTDVEGTTVVLVNVDEDSAGLHIEQEQGDALRVPIEVGATVTVGDGQYVVRAIDDDSGDRDGPKGQASLEPVAGG